MLKFIDKAEYQLISAQWKDDGKIKWTYIDADGRFHSGFFVRGRKSNHQRDEADFFPFNEVQAETTVLPRDIENLKSEATSQINQQRDALINGGITHNGHEFQTDEKSIMDVIGAVVAQVPVNWLTKDNQTVSMSAADMAALGAAIAAHKESLVYQARTHKDNILAMTTAQDIESYMNSLSWS